MLDMRFPGENYRVILDDPTRNVAALAKQFGITEIFSEAKPRYPDMAGFTYYRPDYVNDVVISGDNTYPLFIVGITNLRTLESWVEQGHKTIFVQCSWSNSKEIQIKHAVKYAEPQRWLFEYSHQVDFIMFGSFDYEFYYCTGAAGCVAKKEQATWHINEDGAQRKKSKAEVSEYIKTKYPGKPTFFYNTICYKEAAIFAAGYYTKRIEKPAPIELFTKHDRRSGRAFRTSRTSNALANTAHHYIYPSAHRMLYNDGIFCSTCSLNYCCRLFRPLGVCTMPGTKGSELVTKFQSEDARDIISGLGDLTARQAALLEQAYHEVEQKQVSEGTTPTLEDIQTLNKLTSDLFKNGVTLAKLRNPNLTKAKLDISIKNSNDQPAIEGQVVDVLEELDDRQKSEIIRKMVEAGFDRNEITPESMLQFIGKGDQPQLEVKDDPMDVF